jgi:serine/threonine protein kinase
MITPRGQSKLLDFGLAKVRRSIQEENTSDATAQLKTAEGIVIGTVMYMSPEQALIDSIAVLPLVNASGEANVEYLSDGITESISARSF